MTSPALASSIRVLSAALSSEMAGAGGVSSFLRSSSVTLSGGVIGGTPSTIAWLRTSPRSISACVSLYVPVASHDSPAAIEVGILDVSRVRPCSSSVRTMFFNVVLPVFVIVNL